MDTYSYLHSINPDMVEELYRKFKQNPESVEQGWKNFFEGYEFAKTDYTPVSDIPAAYPREFKVISLINAYRHRGHLFTETNPVRRRRIYKPTLDLENFGLAPSDLHTEFYAGKEIGIGRKSLNDIVAHLRATYCQSVGVEYQFIQDVGMLSWLQTKMEAACNTYPFTLTDKKYILQKLCRAVHFEKFMHKKFPGQKRFSLEGAETLIPAIEAIMEKAAELGSKELIMGTAHRGRLNILANILKKPYGDIFSEFEDKEYDDETLLGDVKYHLGYTAQRRSTKGEKIKITLAPNPSHLEAVNPVVEGIARAKIEIEYQANAHMVVPILIHGDASIAGQGIVYETLQLSGLEGYQTGGTIHVVINNQIGFTTDYLDSRTSTYCTDVAKTIQAPVFHVNGDDVQAVVYIALLATEFRNKFHKDVFIDLLCYRKYGHNEGDEPRFTQPLLYKAIEKHPNAYDIYKKKIAVEKEIPLQEIQAFENKLRALLEKSYEASLKIEKTHISSFLEDTWRNIEKATEKNFETSPETGVKKEILLDIALKITEIPDTFHFFRKTIQLQNRRRQMAEQGRAVDWAMGELLAYASLLLEGIPVRLSGQDVERGTFSHRHAVLRVEDSEKEYVPLNNIHENQAKFDIYNSPLSEYGVLGFEYGYSLSSPYSLTLWEAQYGDFCNGAQIIVDQFLCSAEEKWNVMNGMVLLLPHGYEGQGPEHSSARLERFLTLCADNNIQIVNCSTPANMFHVLRRQLKRNFRKPLVIFTPKSLLRHPRCVSDMEDFSTGKFQEAIDDDAAIPGKISKVVFCSGKIYYELLAEKEKNKNTSIAFIRIEQLYPLPVQQLEKIIARYNKCTHWLWVQEEPVNMGAWIFMYHTFTTVPLKVIARPESGSPATGSTKFHSIRQRKIIDKTFEKCQCPNVYAECKMICMGNKWRSFEKKLKKKGKDMDSTSFSADNKL